MGGIGAGGGWQKRCGAAVMFAQILQQGPDFVHAHQNAVTSGAIQHLTSANAPCGQRRVAKGAGVVGIAGDLNAVLIGGRRALTAAVIEDE